MTPANDRLFQGSVARILHDLPHAHSEAFAEGLQSIDGDVLLAAFDRTVVGPVHANLIGVTLLAIALSYPSSSKRRTNTDVTADFLHREARYKPSSLISTVI